MQHNYVAHMELKSHAFHNALKMLMVFVRFVLFYSVAIHIKPSSSKNGWPRSIMNQQTNKQTTNESMDKRCHLSVLAKCSMDS